MTELETLQMMLKRAGVPFEVSASASVDVTGCTTMVEVSNGPIPGTSRSIGYGGFVGDWFFDKEGRLITVGHYE